MQINDHVMMVLDDLSRQVTAYVRVAGGIPKGIYEHPAMRAINTLAEAYPGVYEAWAARARHADGN